MANLSRILRCLYLVSGLRINLKKSSIFGIGVPSPEVSSMARILKCKVGMLPFKYLGLWVGADMNKVSSWDPIIELFKSRLSIWKAKKLSYGGRATLIKSVLNALPTYYFSLYKAPSAVFEILERIRRRFFWGGSEDVSRIHWIAWHNVIKEKKHGGLGFGSLKESNYAMLAKWWWRFKVDKDALWWKVVWSIHHSSNHWNVIPVKLSIPGPWKQITKINQHCIDLGIDLSKEIRCFPGHCALAMFWVDYWIGDGPLSIKFPLLFALERNKGCLVQQRVFRIQNGISWSWQWKRNNMLEEEVLELMSLYSLIWAAPEADTGVKWQWGLELSGLFSVGSFKRAIHSELETVAWLQHCWNSWVPKKVILLAWKVIHQRLPTRNGLMSRNINISSSLCPICEDAEESVNHLFVVCEFAQSIWNIVSHWCGIPPIYAFSILDLVGIHKFTPLGSTRKRILNAIVLTSFWCIWQARNKLIFEGSPVELGRVIEEIKILSFMWVNSRTSKCDMDWSQWSRTWV